MVFSNAQIFEYAYSSIIVCVSSILNLKKISLHLGHMGNLIFSSTSFKFLLFRFSFLILMESMSVHVGGRFIFFFLYRQSIISLSLFSSLMDDGYTHIQSPCMSGAISGFLIQLPWSICP
jgi:hypothetical protein